MTGAIVQAVLVFYPDAQAIYLYGSYDSDDARSDSDVDIAILLPPEKAKKAGSLAMSELRFSLEDLLKNTVDLVNLRLVSTILRKEVVATGRRIHTGDEYAADEFEMLTISFYQKLNEERAEILDEFWKTGKAYRV